MAERKANINVGVVGMDRTTFNHHTDEKVYTFQLNGNIETDEQGGIALTNEHSNLLCSRFKPGYYVIGNKFDVNSNRVYFFLTNPTTGLSEIGYIKYYHSVEDLEDNIQECNCSYESILSEPLESQEQLEGCEYTTLIADCEGNKCLNFSRLHPIHKIEIKGEKYFKSIYWTDGYNPPRHLQLNNLEQYTYNGTEVCGEIICDEKTTGKKTASRVEDCVTCLDCEKLRMFKRYSIPRIEPTTIQYGGNLRRGSYEFLIAYADRLGNELSEYFSITNPIHIFDKNNYILTQPQLADRTNFSITLEVSNLDNNFQFYKVVVIQRADINGETSYFVEGVHPISDTTVLYTTELDKQKITIQEIFAQKPIFKTWKGLTASNNYLFGYGYTTEKEWNLQPVVNLLGGFLKWQTYQAKQTLYEDGVAASKYKGYMRDEVYPFSIRFGTKDGYWTSLFPLVPRPATEEELEEIVYESNNQIITSDKNAASIINNAPNCASTDRTKYWQYYNTAEFEGYCTSYDLEDFDTIVRTTTEICKVRIDDGEGGLTDVIDTIPAGTITIPINTSNFRGLKNWFKENKDLIYKCCTGSNPCSEIKPEGDCPDSDCVDSSWGAPFPPEICNLATNTYSEYHCEPGLPFDICCSCGDPDCCAGDPDCDCCSTDDDLKANQCLPPVLAECSEEVPFPEDVYIKQVQDEQFWLVEKRWADGEEPFTEYTRTEPFGKPTMYIDSQGTAESDGFFSGRLIDFTFANGCGDSGSNCPLVHVLKRLSDMMYNDSCSVASEIFEKEYSNFNYFFDYQFQESCDDSNPTFDRLITDHPSIPFPNTITTAPGGYGYFLVENPNSIGFTDKISKKSLWFRLTKDDLRFANEGEEPTVIVEATKAQTDFLDEYPYKPEVFFERSVINDYYRVTILDSCSPDANIIFCEKVHKDDGWWRMIKESDFTNTGEMFIVFDSPIHSYVLIDLQADNPRPYGCTGDASKFTAITPLNGTINIIKRYKEYKCAEITHSGIQISKKETYTATCRYIIPFLNDCEPSPFAYGKFAYWESTENYPDNQDLYDSSKLIISEEDLPEYLREEFEEKYVVGNTTTGDYYLNPEVTDLRCKPIRHYKFPSNTTQNASFLFNTPTVDSNDTIIYPIGITIDDQAINAFLDIAVKNELITQEQRDSITNYEIYRGDRTIHKSVLFKGIANDMYRYFDRGQEKWFRNFPFNTLGENQFLYENNFRANFIQHPYDSEGNNKFSIIAPEVYYSQPSTGNEVVIEGYQMGYADGVFREVQEHSKWVILGDRAKDLASTLATLEVTFESAMNIGDSLIGMATSMWSGITAFSWGFGFGIAGNVMITVANVVSALLFKYSRYKYEWLEIFKNNGIPYNFAYRYVGTGNYNFFTRNSEEDSLLRGIVVGRYLKPGNAIINDEKGKKVIRVNNIDRESSYFVSFGQEYPVEYIPSYINWDNADSGISSASRYLSSDAGCDGSTSTRRVGSPYMSVKVYNPAQYGTLDSIRWIPINHDSVLPKTSEQQNTCKGIFGGDVYISRVAFKNKYRFFLVDAMKLADRTPFDYHLYSNIGSSRFYASYETPITQISHGRPIPYADTTFVFNCPNEETTYSNDFYVKPVQNRSHKFFLHSFGIPYFFVESTINNEFRHAGPEPHEQFYPNIDEIEWTEETKNNFFHNNTFFYNNTYSKDTTPNGARTLPSFYNKEEWDELYEYPNGVVWSQQDNSEQDLRDPWLVYKPLDKYQFPTDYGRLIDLTGIESYQVLGRFENNALIFNAVDTIADRLTEATAVLGTGGIFTTRPTEFSHTELGETGSQHTDLVTTEFGHFWTDAKRGAIFQLHPNAKGLTQISAFKRDGQPSGMRQWFKRHLPFKILKKETEGLTEQSNILDNKYLSLGINMWWDSKFKRLFITKRDKIIQDPCIKYSDEIGFYIDETECNGAEPIKSCPLGYTYNPDTEMCEKEITSNPCRTGYTYNPEDNTCIKQETTEPEIEEEIITTITCEEGYTYNPTTEMCEKIEEVPNSCPEGYTYDSEKGVCVLDECVTDILLLLDHSGSMDSTEYAQMQDFFIDIIDGLEPQINSGAVRVGVVAFGNAPRLLAPYTPFVATIKNAINTPQITGGTNVRDALCFCEDYINNNRRPAAKSQLIVYLDGAQNMPSTDPCDTTDYLPEREIARRIKDNTEITLVYAGDMSDPDEVAEIEIVKNLYINPNFPDSTEPPIPSPGAGLYGRRAWGADFVELNTILEDVLESLECEDNILPSCPNGCTSIPDTDLCSCFYQTEPTIKEETIIHYNCPEGWTFNERDLVCERTIVEQGCGDECTVSIEGCNCTEQVDPIIDTIKTPVDPKDFKDVSWTVSYSPLYDSWVSYYSFTPDYAVSFNDYFQTGHNNEEDKRGVWSHLLTNKSFQVFYGKKYSWTIEVPFKNEYVSKVLEAVNISADTYRYHNEFDYAHARKKSFDSAVIYNSTNNTGVLKLNYSDAADDYKYPIQVDSITQGIKATHHKGMIRFNYFFNRVADENSNLPIWKWDDNEILKTLDPRALTYTKKNPLERMRGQSFLLRLSQNSSSQYKQLYKWSFGKEHIDEM